MEPPQPPNSPLCLFLTPPRADHTHTHPHPTPRPTPIPTQCATPNSKRIQRTSAGVHRCDFFERFFAGRFVRGAAGRAVAGRFVTGRGAVIGGPGGGTPTMSMPALCWRSMRNSSMGATRWGRDGIQQGHGGERNGGTGHNHAGFGTHPHACAHPYPQRANHNTLPTTHSDNQQPSGKGTYSGNG